MGIGDICVYSEKKASEWQTWSVAPVYYQLSKKYGEKKKQEKNFYLNFDERKEEIEHYEQMK